MIPQVVKYFYCTKEGYKPNRKTDPNKPEKRKRSSYIIGCPAIIKVQRLSDNLVEVVSLVEKHNHSLTNKSDVQFLRAYRQLIYTQKQFIHNVSFAKLGPVHSFKLMKHMYGGFENVGTTVSECKNFRRDVNMFIGDRDAQMAVEKLMNRKEFVPGFFVDYITDDDKALAGLFWADREAKMNYEAFGDVVSFDATFRSNKFQKQRSISLKMDKRSLLCDFQKAYQKFPLGKRSNSTSTV